MREIALRISKSTVHMYSRRGKHVAENIHIRVEHFQLLERHNSMHGSIRLVEENMHTSPVPEEGASRYIHSVRGQRVVLDADLASLYGVDTRRLNEQVRRNPQRFPADFAFELTNQEVRGLMSQFATSNSGRGGRRKAMLAFTEHGALMAATVLSSGRAVEVSLYVVRAFVQLREAARQDKALVAKLDALERKTEALALQQEALSVETRKQISDVLRTIRELMTPPATARRSIGFVNPDKQG